MNYLDTYEDLRNSDDCFDYSLSFNKDSALFQFICDIDMRDVTIALNKYPSNYYNEFKNLLCLHYGPNSFMLGSGSENLIWHINRLILRNKKVGVLLPNFYRIYQTLKKPIFIDVPYRDDNAILHIEKLIDAARRENFEAVWISNPNPITGKAYYARDIIQLAESFPKTLFVIDEASIEATMEPEKYSVLSMANNYRNLLVIRSFSKLYGLPGMRLGYVAGKKELIDKLEGNAQVFPVTGLSILIAKKIFENKVIFDNIRKKINFNRSKISTLLQNRLHFYSLSSLTQTIVIGCNSLNMDLWTCLKEEGVLGLSLKNERGIGSLNSVRLTIHSDEKSFLHLYQAVEKVVQKSFFEATGE